MSRWEPELRPRAPHHQPKAWLLLSGQELVQHMGSISWLSPPPGGTLTAFPLRAQHRGGGQSRTPGLSPLGVS